MAASVDADEAESITDEAVRAGVPTVVGLQYASPQVRQAAELVRSGHLGRVVSTSIVGPGWRGARSPTPHTPICTTGRCDNATVPAAHALTH
jgi:predicted dehydrogenase